METHAPHTELTESKLVILAKGLGNSVLNVGRFIDDFIHYDPSPDALSSMKPGLGDAIRELRQDKKAER